MAKNVSKRSSTPWIWPPKCVISDPRTWLKKYKKLLLNSLLSQKMCSLDLPDHIYNWVVNYFNNRSHITSHQGALSRLVVINDSVIQGSVMGPPSYIVQASDLHPVHV